MQRVLSPVNDDNKDIITYKNKENQKQIYLSKMIQMMDYYDYTPDKIDNKIIQQSYDDNTALDEFIMNINNDINPAPPSIKDSKLGKDDRSRAAEGYGLFPCQQPETITEPLNNGLYGGETGASTSGEAVDEPKKGMVAQAPCQTPAWHDVWHDVCADSGATEDVLNSRCGVGANNKMQVDDIILMGMGGEVKIGEVGDYIFSDELKSEGALINDSCNMSCLSVPARCSRGWSL